MRQVCKEDKYYDVQVRSFETGEWMRKSNVKYRTYHEALDRLLTEQKVEPEYSHRIVQHIVVECVVSKIAGLVEAEPHDEE